MPSAVAPFYGPAVPAKMKIRKVKTARLMTLAGIAYTAGLQSN
jgi:hypothetical protein